MGKTGDFLCIKWLLLMMNRSSWKDCQDFCHGSSITAESQQLSMIAALKVEFSDMEISILTGYREFDYCQKAIRLGVSRFLLKPSNMTELEEALKAMTGCLRTNRRRSSTGKCFGCRQFRCEECASVHRRTLQ